MSDYRGHFDLLHFTESVLGSPRLEGDTLAVPVSGLFLLRGHPLQTFGNGPFAGELLFRGVEKSRRTVIEYIGDFRALEGFKTPYVEQFPATTGKARPGRKNSVSRGINQSQAPGSTTG
jgi:hypothetical protein